MKSKYEYDDYFRENGTSRFLRIVITLLFIPHLFLSQIYISKDAKVFGSDKLIGTPQHSQKEKTKIYAVDGTIISGLDQRSVIVDYVAKKKQKNTNVFIAKRKTSDSKNLGKTISEPKATPKKQLLVYKPLNNQNRYSPLQKDSTFAIVPSSSFYKNVGIRSGFTFSISTAFSSKNNEIFSFQNENITLIYTAHTVRPPPFFCGIKRPIA